MSPMKIPNFLIDRDIIPGYNHIVNGNFDIWQRAYSQTHEGYGSDDCWRNAHLGTTKTHSLQNFTLGETFPDGAPTPRLFSRTVVNSVAGIGNYCHKYQHIENVRMLSGKKAVLSFYAKADSSKLVAFEACQYFGGGGSPSASVYGISAQKILLTSTWKKYRILIDFPSVVGKILGTNNSDSAVIVFWFDAGSNFDSRTDFLGHQSGTFDIACVSLTEGTTAVPAPPRSDKEELQLCKRYYEELGIHFFKPNLNTSFGGFRIVQKFSVPKRVSPIISFYSDHTKTIYGQMNTNKGLVSVSALSTPGSDGNALYFHNANDVLTAEGDYGNVYVTVDASI